MEGTTRKNFQIRIRFQKRWWEGVSLCTFEFNGTEGPVGKSYDVLGDGSLVMVNIPGHSEGLCALKVKNQEGKYALLFADGGYATKSWRDMITSGITLDKKMQRQSLEWIREQSLSPDCIESLATHDTDVQPHVIELNNILSLQQILKQNARFFATYIGNSRAITLFEIIKIKRFAFNDKTALESVALMNAGIG